MRVLLIVLIACVAYGWGWLAYGNGGLALAIVGLSAGGGLVIWPLAKRLGLALSIAAPEDKDE